ncbi:hypothetical protein ACU8IW_001971 [Listeria innocua]|uniref:hypothetical protein n=1 Tax=Listeria TaxID=1637 RepID=UPI0010B2CD1D|nr:MULTISPECIES: hypothetical protein [Listeria]EAC2632611.1 hypothetical protein [Listeria monocytogenes]EAD0716505.1 hypothetical protein [Listeria monocytogenes]EAD1618507.1 hypothetical protein [Listeria monocytogenes]EAD3267070.1 hypothetical protein [Listeria monocytogenes]EAD3583413.1 hypothetical protein [Listeria monocytogenes]
MRKKVNNNISSTPIVINDIITSFNGVRIDFKNNNWLKSNSCGDFTTFLFSDDEFGKNVFTILNKVIPMIQSEWRRIIANNVEHCHRIDDTHKQVFKKYFGKHYPKYNIDELNIWQFGASGGARLIASVTKEENGISVVRPLFIDYHHIVYPNKKHNQKDLLKYKFCPYSKYN